MNDCNDRLQHLLKASAGRDHAAAVLKNLREQRMALEQKTWDLWEERVREQADVDRLERKSFQSAILDLLGSHDEKLGREKAELTAAILKYESARQELKNLEALISQKWAKLNEMERAAAEYDRLLVEKERWIDAQGGLVAREVNAYRERIGQLEARDRELSEAICETETAAKMVVEIIDRLCMSQLGGFFDLLSLGTRGFAKYLELQNAKDKIAELQAQLRKLRSELSDVVVSDETDLAFSASFRAVDIFIDDVFTAIFTMVRVDGVLKHMEQLQKTLADLLMELQARQAGVRREILESQEQLKICIHNTKV